MASTMISSGTRRNSSSNVPTSTVGCSQRFTTSRSVFSGSSARAPVRCSACATPSRMTASRACSLDTTCAASTTPSRSAAVATSCGPGARKRWPRVRLPAVRPANRTGITRSSNNATSQRTGREKYSLVVPQRHDFGHEVPVITPSSTPGSSSATSRAAMLFVANTYSTPFSSRRSSASTSTPLPRAKPVAAFVGLPSASKAILADGPRNTSSSASVSSATSATMAMSRRGVV